MKHVSATNTLKKGSASGVVNKGGFALIATISVMTLLVMIALAMLSLSTIEIRQSQNSNHQATAQANARMALMIAIGELQKYAGPDQRVTATADINRDTSADKKHLTGVWSTENWDPTDPESKIFSTWLATVPFTDPATPTVQDSESALTPYSVVGSQLVTVVGNGTLGDSSNVEDHVKVATVPTRASPNMPGGSIAYWVSDEATKASYAIPMKENALGWNKAAKMGTSPRTGIEAFDNTTFSNYADLMKNSTLGAAPTYQTLDAAYQNTEKVSAKHFHSMTHRTISLFTNTRHGGAKSDLSTAFELELEDFNALTEFHFSNEQNNTSNYDTLNGGTYNQPQFYPSSHRLGYLFEVPYNGGVVRGPTWDLLRNHYRVYKRDAENLNWPRQIEVSNDDTIAARGSLPLSYSTTRGAVKDVFSIRSSPGGIYGNSLRHGNWASYINVAEPITNGQFNTSSGVTRSTAARIAPMIVRLSFVIGLRKKQYGQTANDWRLALSFDPYVTIVNPYNRAIEFESLGMYSAKMNPLRFTFEYSPEDSSKPPIERDLMFSVNVGTNGSLAYRLLPPGSGVHRLEPGQVKVLSPLPEGGDDQEFVVRGKNMIEAAFDYGEDTGLFLYPGAYKYYWNPPVIKPKASSTVKLTMTGRYNGSFASHAGETFTFSQLKQKDHSGRSRDLRTHIPPYMQANHDVFDDSLITRLGFSTYDSTTTSGSLTNHPLYAEVSINESSIPDVGESGLYVGVLDVRMKHTGDDAPVFHHFSPRGRVFDTRNYDGADRSTPAWDVSLRRITDVSELEMVADPSGQGYWGSGLGASSGQTKVVLFDLPRSPITSLGLLSQADIALLPSNGAAPIGNSFTQPGLSDVTKIIGRRTLANPGFTTKAPQTLADFSWAANEALWDQYFFSSMNWGSARLAYESGKSQPFTSQIDAVDSLIDNSYVTESPLANPRVIPLLQGSDTAIKDELKDYAQIAKHLGVVGGFNVNSTSVDAWKAVLSGLKGAEIGHLSSNGNVTHSKANAPFSRFQLPAGGDGDEWAGYRDLSDSEISKLAEEIVEQVKTRGPFMGMADFVNRRLYSGGLDGSDVGKLGALQMAIESAGLNDSRQHNVSSGNVENKTIASGGNTITTSTYTGTPGYLMQSDVLTSLGSILRARSDTFVVRAYGDAKDAAGRVIARAWCEATVQRTPEWVQPTDEPFKLPNPNYPKMNSDTILKLWDNNPSFPDINRRFGRKMKVIAFRWLASEEI